MATETVAPEVFDPVKFMADRNAKEGKPALPPIPGQPAAQTPKPASSAAPAANGEDAGDHDENDDSGSNGRAPRSVRRSERRQAEEIGFLKGRLAAMEELMRQGYTPRQADQMTAEAPAKPAKSTEPSRDQFVTDTEYAKAWAKWNTGQATGQLKEELKQEAQAQTAEEAFHTRAKANQAKFEAEAATFDDWDEAEAAFNDMAIPSQTKLDTALVLFAECKSRAALTYYLFKNPDEAKDWLQGPEDEFIPKFHELVGTAKAVYTPKESSSQKTAAQAGQPPKTAPKAEKPAQGVPTAAERDIRRAKPSSEVSAGRGGAPAPDQPTPGTAAWMADRNRREFGK